jgi:hypothetical protein
MTADDLKERVIAAEPSIREAFSKRLPPMNALRTDKMCNLQKYGIVVEATDDCLFFDRHEQFVEQICESAKGLATKIRHLFSEANRLDSNLIVLTCDPPNSLGINLFWLENWPLTFTFAGPEKNWKTGYICKGDCPLRVKMSLRGGWRWLSPAERLLIESGRELARLKLPDPKLQPIMDEAEWKAIMPGERYPSIKV